MTDEEEESKEEQNPMSTPANSHMPSESSRIKAGFNDSFDDVVMAELQPQAKQVNDTHGPSEEELKRWYEEGG